MENNGSFHIPSEIKRLKRKIRRQENGLFFKIYAIIMVVVVVVGFGLLMLATWLSG